MQANSYAQTGMSTISALMYLYRPFFKQEQQFSILGETFPAVDLIY